MYHLRLIQMCIRMHISKTFCNCHKICRHTIFQTKIIVKPILPFTVQMKFTIPIDAVPQQRPRFCNGRAYDSPQCAKFKKDFAALLHTDTDLMTDTLKVDITVYRAASKFKQGASSKRYGDCDNLAKGILDACNGVIWKDDSQIVDLHVKKAVADSPQIMLVVDEVKLTDEI